MLAIHPFSRKHRQPAQGTRQDLGKVHIRDRGEPIISAGVENLFAGESELCLGLGGAFPWAETAFPFSLNNCSQLPRNFQDGDRYGITFPGTKTSTQELRWSPWSFGMLLLVHCYPPAKEAS